jgi:hypothetical protein
MKWFMVTIGLQALRFQLLLEFCKAISIHVFGYREEMDITISVSIRKNI